MRTRHGFWLAALVALAGMMPAAAAPDLVGTAWVSDGYSCGIRTMEFDKDTVVFHLNWTTSPGRWSVKDDRFTFTFDEIEGQLTGGFRGDSEIDLTFQWVTTQGAPHFDKCVFHRQWKTP